MKKLALLLLTLLLLCLTIYPVEYPKGQTQVSTSSEHIQVYWESSCINTVDHIDWETLFPGEAKNITVYVRNEGISPVCYIYIWAYDWLPVEAEKLMHFSWSGPKEVNLNQAIPVTFTLEISRHIKNITEFSFLINILVSEHSIIGDINMDGTVNIYDVVTVTAAYDTTPQDPRWNPLADLNNDGIIDIYDVTIVCHNYGYP